MVSILPAPLQHGTRDDSDSRLPEPVKEWNACVVDVTSICRLGATLNYDIALAMNQEGRDKEEGSRTQGESELRWRRSQ